MIPVKRRVLWLVTLVTFSCVLGGVLSRLRRPLVVTPLNCGRLMPAGVCAFVPGALRLVVEPHSDVNIVFGGGHMPKVIRGRAARGAVLAVDVDRGWRSLWVLAVGNGGFGVGRVRLVPLARPEWLQRAMTDWLTGDAQTLTRIVTDLEGRRLDVLTPSERAEVLQTLGAIAKHQVRIPDAKRLLRKAIAMDRETGPVSTRAINIFVLAGLLSEFDLRPTEAEALLDEEAAVLNEARSLLPWVLQNRGTCRTELADLRGALRYRDEGLALARRLEDDVAMGAMVVQRARTLAALGRFDEAEAALRAPLKPLACLENYRLEARAELRLARWEVRWPSLAQPGDAYDPRSALEEALAARQHSCADRHISDELKAARVRAALLSGDVAMAAAGLSQLQGTVTDPLMRLTVAERAAEVALAQGALQEAQDGFARVAQLAADPASAAAVRGSPTWPRYRAHLGLGQVFEARAQRAAVAAERADLSERAVSEYRAAEVLLDRQSEDVPLELGRTGYLGRYEGSARLLVDLLGRLGRPRDALAVLRRARTRGLRTLLRVASLAQMDAAQAAAWQVQQGQIQETRAALDRANAVKLEVLPADQAALEQERRRALEGKLLRQLGDAQAALGQAPEAPLASPLPGEVLLGCHEARRDWLCVAADDHEVRVARLPQALLEQAAAAAVALSQALAKGEHGPVAAAEQAVAALRVELAQRLMPPLADLLRRAQVLKVLGQGAFRAVDMHLLPWEGRPLFERLDVRYALDLPVATAAAQVEPPRALVSFGALTLSQGLVAQAQREARAGLSRLGLAVVEPSGPGGAELRALLAGVDVLHYFGHGQPAPLYRQGRLLGAGNPLLVGDLLLLPRAPRAVVLLACNAGQASEESGGLEGLSVASAFLLRGSAFVIAAPVALPAEAAAGLARGLYQPGFLQAPSAALRRLIQETDASDAAAAATARLLRIYVP